MKTYANIYYRARMQAAQREPLHASRERTASEIFVSCEALADYETGRTVPPCDVVQKMVEAYNDPDLKAAHIRACCPLLPDYGGEGCSELARGRTGLGHRLPERAGHRTAVCHRRPRRAHYAGRTASGADDQGQGRGAAAHHGRNHCRHRQGHQRPDEGLKKRRAAA